MPDAGQPNVSISVGGNNTGAIWAGNQNRVIINERTGAATEISAQEVRSLADSIAALREKVASQAPPEQRAAAVAQVDKLQDAILPKPQVNKMQEVRDWFVKHAPAVLGTVTSLFVNPIVGKIVEAAGDMAASAFVKRFS